MYKMVKVPFLLRQHIYLSLSFFTFISLFSLSLLVFLTIFNYVCLLYIKSHNFFLLSPTYTCFSDCKTSYLWHATQKSSQKNYDAEVASFPRWGEWVVTGQTLFLNSQLNTLSSFKIIAIDLFSVFSCQLLKYFLYFSVSTP